VFNISIFTHSGYIQIQIPYFILSDWWQTSTTSVQALPQLSMRRLRGVPSVGAELLSSGAKKRRQTDDLELGHLVLAPSIACSWATSHQADNSILNGYYNIPRLFHQGEPFREKP